MKSTLLGDALKSTKTKVVDAHLWRLLGNEK